MAGSNVIAARLAVDDRAAEALRHTAHRLCRHPATRIPHRIFPSDLGALGGPLCPVLGDVDRRTTDAENR
jgi:hypothetical protein